MDEFKKKPDPAPVKADADPMAFLRKEPQNTAPPNSCPICKSINFISFSGQWGVSFTCKDCNNKWSGSMGISNEDPGNFRVDPITHLPIYDADDDIDPPTFYGAPYRMYDDY